MLRKLTLKIAVVGMILTSLLGANLMVDAPVAYAQDEATQTTEETTEETAQAADGTTDLELTTDRIINELAATISIVLMVLNYLLWPVLVLIGALMDNDLIIGGGMEERLRSIWTQIRNLVNLGFVLILVGIAIYNVLGIDTDGNYAIKKMLPKLVLGAILVNFSFFGVTLILDAANVVTTAMFALPDAVESGFDESRIAQLSEQICQGVKGVETSAGTGTQTTRDLAAATGGLANEFCLDESTLTTQARVFFQSFSHNNMALVMAVQFGQIHEFLDTSQLVKENPNIANLTVNLLFSSIMFIVYSASYLALLAVLLARVAVLWAVIALSPLIAIQIALPEGTDLSGDVDLKELFITHLVAPIKIGFGMSVGYIMLSALSQIGPDSLTFTLGNQFIAPFSGISTVQELIIAMLAVAVVWTVTFSAASKTKAGVITDRIRDWVGDRGRDLAGLPLYAPIIATPTPGGDKGTDYRSVKSFLDGPGKFRDTIEKMGEKEQPPDTKFAPLTKSKVENNFRGRERVTSDEADTTIQYALNEDIYRHTRIKLSDLRNLAEKSRKLKPDTTNGKKLKDLLDAEPDLNKRLDAAKKWNEIRNLIKNTYGTSIPELAKEETKTDSKTTTPPKTE